MFDTQGRFLQAWSLGHPFGLFITRDHVIYMSDAIASRILKLDRNGRVLGVWRGPQRGRGPHFDPHQIAVGDGRKTMTQGEGLLPEFDQEMASTRRSLEQVPDDRFEWKPHPKSMTLGGLTTFLAILPGWATTTIMQESLELPDAPSTASVAKSLRAALELFDKNVSEARAALAGAAGRHLMQPWTLIQGGKEVFFLPRVVVLRSFVMNHMIHHRAQLVRSLSATERRARACDLWGVG